MTNTLYVYCSDPGPRIRYVFEFIRIQWKLDELKFLDKISISNFTGSVLINYSADSLPQSSLQFIPSSITKSGRKMVPEQLEWVDDVPYFFKTNKSAAGVQAYDIPGMIFYMLSRMEEYENPERDLLGRLVGKNCFAAKNGFLHLPVIDLWIEELAKIYFGHTTNFIPAPAFHLTVDIDIAWAFANRPLWENLGGAFKELISLRWKKFQARWEFWTGSKKDPFEVYEYLKEIQDQHGPVQFFILLGDRTELDRSFHWKNPAFTALIKMLSKSSDIGIHPSSKASGNLSILTKEKQRLESILLHEVKKSRQHYLLLHLPQTYRDLLSAGITEDYTMGFHDLPGCRAGTTKPFYWYDLESEQETELSVHPFYIMDVTLKNYMRMSASEASDWMQKQKIQFSHWNLPMTLVWHNSSFFESDGWIGWREVLEIIFPK